jgi:hypothetical protein
LTYGGKPYCPDCFPIKGGGKSCDDGIKVRKPDDEHPLPVLPPDLDSKRHNPWTAKRRAQLQQRLSKKPNTVECSRDGKKWQQYRTIDLMADAMGGVGVTIRKKMAAGIPWNGWRVRKIKPATCPS